jgi:hypothetical protein
MLLSLMSMQRKKYSNKNIYQTKSVVLSVLYIYVKSFQGKITYEFFAFVTIDNRDKF